MDDSGKPYSLFADTFIRGIESGEAAPGKETINLIDISGYIHSQRNKDGKETLPYLDTTNAAGYLEFARNPDPGNLTTHKMHAPLDSGNGKVESGRKLRNASLAVIVTGVVGSGILYFQNSPGNPSYPTPYYGDVASPTKLGLTGQSGGFVRNIDNVVSIACYDDSSLEPKCGATDASAFYARQLPLLCISFSNDDEVFRKAKGELSSSGASTLNWSSGKVKITPPLIPPKKLGDANQVCKNEFGNDYRVADFNDVSEEASYSHYFLAVGNILPSAGVFWLDDSIDQDQVCWSNRDPSMTLPP